MNTVLKKNISRIKKILHKNKSLDVSKCGVFCDWTRILIVATFVAFTLTSVGGYLFFSAQHSNRDIVEQQYITGKTFDFEKLKWLVSSYQARAVDFETLRKNSPTIPQTGFNTAEVFVTDEDVVVEEKQNTNQADWRTLQ